MTGIQDHGNNIRHEHTCIQQKINNHYSYIQLHNQHGTVRNELF